MYLYMVYMYICIWSLGNHHKVSKENCTHFQNLLYSIFLFNAFQMFIITEWKQALSCKLYLENWSLRLY